MIGIVLVTHGRLGEEFAAALQHVVGPQEALATVSIGPDDDMEQRRRDVVEATRAVDRGHGVAILTDMFGGTPSNLAMSVTGSLKVDVLCGVNLPMLVKLASVRQTAALADAVAQARDAGRKYIKLASSLLDQPS